MTRPLQNTLRKRIHQAVRSAVALLPRDWRFALMRSMIDCDPAPDPRLELKIADTREELEACFRILHDAYVASGFMRPDPSGLRVTIYHALPTTTTLCAKFDGEVVGTLSIIREGVFGFPLQTVFDLSPVRAKQGRIAEISALAVHPRFRQTGGAVLFPLMKFMYEYCTRYFDTRHLLIAVNPNKIELYESLLFFERLQASVVDNYDFANGAPAIGATLDLHNAPQRFHDAYGGRSERKNLHRYFVRTRLPNIRLPLRRYHTTNDPVMTPALLNYFFNLRTQTFSTLDERKRRLLRTIYPQQEYLDVLPALRTSVRASALRRHERHSIKCPAHLILTDRPRPAEELEVIELSLHGFQAEARSPLPLGAKGRVVVQLGAALQSCIDAVVVRRVSNEQGLLYAFRVDEPDEAWRECVTLLRESLTHYELSRPMGEEGLVSQPAGLSAA